MDAVSEGRIALFMKHLFITLDELHAQNTIHLDIRVSDRAFTLQFALLCSQRTSKLDRHQRRKSRKCSCSTLGRRFAHVQTSINNVTLQTIDGAVKGVIISPEFVAPEVIDDELATFKADVWSAGVLAYVLWAKNQARNGRNEQFAGYPAGLPFTATTTR